MVRTPRLQTSGLHHRYITAMITVWLWCLFCTSSGLTLPDIHTENRQHSFIFFSLFFVFLLTLEDAPTQRQAWNIAEYTQIHKHTHWLHSISPSLSLPIAVELYWSTLKTSERSISDFNLGNHSGNADVTHTHTRTYKYTDIQTLQAW